MSLTVAVISQCAHRKTHFIPSIHTTVVYKLYPNRVKKWMSSQRRYTEAKQTSEENIFHTVSHQFNEN